jgi:diguanylate cyclase (GGDEF)-like protein/PAS domain S-box-containing protein
MSDFKSKDEYDKTASELQSVQKALAESMDECRIWIKIFESSSQGILITAADGTISDVNAAFTKITGYSKEEAVGKKPSLLKSDRHDKAFYTDMWQTIFASGHWEGEVWDRRKSGEIYPKWLSINAIRNAENQITHFVGMFTDITCVKQAEGNLEHVTNYDFLTGLPNRSLFDDRLRQALYHSGRKKKMAALMFLDLDRFKLINEALGHRAGDDFLVEAARRILDCVSKSDTVSRFGADEFTVLLTGITDTLHAARVAGNILENVSRSFMLEDQEIFITVSIGITLFPNDGEDVETLMRNADAALSYAKEKGKNNFQFYSKSLYAGMTERLTLETDLRNALTNKELFFYYQPKVSIQTGKMTGAEALIRWKDADHHFISPEKFIPIAEETGLIFPIFDAALKEIVRICPRIRELRKGDNAFRIAVNLSFRQFQHQNLIEKIKNILTECRTAGCVEIELTESTIMHETDEVIKTLNTLKEMDINCSIDDFGTGYSSLSYLKRLPIDTLKIDRSFIKDIPEDTVSMAIVRAIIALGHSMKIKIVAEGVETQAQLNFLREENCDEVQGYYFFRPMPEAEFLALLEKDYP